MKLPRKLTMNTVVDYMAFALFVFLTTTGVLMRYLLPPGSGYHTRIWDLDRHAWGTVHFWIAIALFGILSIHIILHWKWIISVLKGRPSQGGRSKFLLGLGSLMAVVALGLSPVVSTVQVDEDAPRGRGASAGIQQPVEHTEGALDFEDVPIYGAMTFREVSEVTGVPITYITRQLGISGISEDDRIGRLGREKGFDISAVRRIVASYREHRQSEDSDIDD